MVQRWGVTPHLEQAILPFSRVRSGFWESKLGTTAWLLIWKVVSGYSNRSQDIRPLASAQICVQFSHPLASAHVASDSLNEGIRRRS